MRPVAVILAGGANSRFWPLREKSLLRFAGETLLARHLRLLANNDVHDAIVVGNPSNVDMLRTELSALDRPDVAVVIQADARGMGDAVLQAEAPLTERFAGRPVVFCQAHDVVEPSLFSRLLGAAADGDADGWIVGQPVDRYFPGGYLSLDGDRITGIVEKPGEGNEPSNVVNIVLHVVRDVGALLASIRDAYAAGGETDDHYERALGALVRRGVYQLVRYTGRWRPIKYPWHVLDVVELLLGEIAAPRIAPDVRLASGAEITGSVVVEENVRLFAGARVVGPAYLGAGTILGDHALVRQSMVGPRCVVGIHTEVARSYVGAHCDFHDNYIGDSVIAEHTSFGAGAITGNLRLNERPIRSMVRGIAVDTGRVKLGAVCGAGVRVGINANLMPGVKVGRNSAVGPGVILVQDLPDETRVLLKQDLAIGPNHPPAGDRSAFRSKL